MDDILKPLKLDKDQLHDIMESIQNAFNHGLASESDNFLYRPVKMLNTHIMVIPNGSEVGRFVALDLGGTNLRILSISVVRGCLVPKSIIYEVPTSAQTGNATDIFDFIAEKINSGLAYLGFQNVDIEWMGFTFSFPCSQLALNSGKLLRWTKGYCARDVEGKDVVLLLLEACRKKGIRVRDFVLINDTTGTLLCGCFEDPSSVIGVINGTGTNACYLEKISEVTKWQGPPYFESVIINTEWGTYGENGELRQYLTPFDVFVDRESINPGLQLFEKMVSGMYLGRIVRHIILVAAKQNLIFCGYVPDFIRHNIDGFPTSFMSEIYDRERFTKLFKNKYNYELTHYDYKRLFEICDTVSKRSAGLIAAGLSALLLRVQKNKCTIAADGSVFKRHPFYQDFVKNYIQSILPNKIFSIRMVEDGSGKGAAMAACVAKAHFERSMSTTDSPYLDSIDEFSNEDLHSM